MEGYPNGAGVLTAAAGSMKAQETSDFLPHFTISTLMNPLTDSAIRKATECCSNDSTFDTTINSDFLNISRLSSIPELPVMFSFISSNNAFHECGSSLMMALASYHSPSPLAIASVDGARPQSISPSFVATTIRSASFNSNRLTTCSNNQFFVVAEFPLIPN